LARIATKPSAQQFVTLSDESGAVISTVRKIPSSVDAAPIFTIFEVFFVSVDFRLSGAGAIFCAIVVVVIEV